MTAEPRMEELLASIRKAIHDDIGDVPVSMSEQSSGTLQRGATREFHVRPAEDAISAAVEIQQLREKIHRTRSSAPPPPPPQLPPRETIAARNASLTAALQNDVPRRPWRELEIPPQPKLRPTIQDSDYHAMDAFHTHPESLAPPPQYHQPSWREEPASLPPPRDARAATGQDYASMLSGDASQAVHSAFNRLADTVLARATGDRSIEDMTRELLRGMLKQWLDDNLPALVEKLVREEIERVARHGR